MKDLNQILNSMIRQSKFYFIYFLLASIILVFQNIPDIDQGNRILNFLLHRSIITHSILIPFICLWLLRNFRFLWIYLPPLFFVFAIHFYADLFSKGWSGYSLISIPFIGRTSAEFSIIWIFSNAVFCTFYMVKLIKEYNPDFNKLTGLYLAAFVATLFNILIYDEHLLSLLMLIYSLDIFSNNYFNKYIFSKFKGLKK